MTAPRLPAAAIIATVALTLATATTAALAQTCEPTSAFGPLQTFPASADHSQVRVADFNGDGVLDILTTARNDGSVDLYAGLGGLSFAPAARQDLGVRMFAIEVADVNGDGSPDLVTTDRNVPEVLVHLNTGDGTFAAPLAYDLGTGEPDFQALADLNDDGILDLVVSVSPDEVVTALGLGDGAFGPAARTSVSVIPLRPVTADFNLDGRVDVAVAGRFDFTLLLGSGGAPLGAKFTLPFDTLDGVFPGMRAADMDGDGILDMVLATDTGTFVTRKGTGRGDFVRIVGSALIRQDIVGGEIVLTDADGDGDIDLVAPRLGGGAIVVRPNLGDGRYGPEITFPAGSRPRELQLADLDGDGDLDLVLLDTTDDVVGVLENLCPAHPIIDRQPRDVVAQTGQPVRLSVGLLSGALPLQYQWRRNGQPLSDGGPFSGTGTPTLTIAATTEQADLYDVVVTNALAEVVSRPAVVSIREGCPGDFDGDGSLTIFDFLAFQNAFAAGCP